MFSIKLRDPFDRRAIRAGIKVDNLLVGVLEWKNDGVGRESSKLGMELLLSTN